MNATRRTLVGLLLHAIGAWGCSGFFLVDEALLDNTSCVTSADCGLGFLCEATTCVASASGCDVDTPNGDCPRGRLCERGVCVCGAGEDCGCPGGICFVPPDPWCDCAPEQGCFAGECRTIDNSNACGDSHPDGLCPGGELCVGARCVPNESPCSDAHPNGWCDPGLACDRGRCVAIADNPCGADRPAGLCRPGQACGGAAGCSDVPCADGVAGVCEEGWVCRDDTCAPMRCSPYFVAGVCDSGAFCSQTGACLRNATCLVDGDCRDSYCGVSETCIPFGACAVDDDCLLRQADVFGQGYACTDDLCVERGTCTLDADCLPSKFCSSGDNCLVPGECDDGSDCAKTDVCSVVGRCIAAGTCGDDEDCAAGEFCASNGTCVAEGSCAENEDCPPGHACDDGACGVSGALCSSNEFTSEGCGENVLTCCATGDESDCCDLGQRCSAAGSCIANGKCVDDTDCLTGYETCVDFVCVGTTSCDACGPAEVCGVDGGCVPSGRCRSSGDCAEGEVCSAGWVCEADVDSACGVENLSVAGVVPPNVLVVIDRSGSMNLCGEGDPLVGACGQEGDALDCTAAADTRWEEAVSAVETLLVDQAGRVRFGLSIYPKSPGGESCALQCNWFSCTDNVNVNAGVIDVATGDDTAGDIDKALGAVLPGGSTPTAPTLRNVLADLPGAGLAAGDRPNAVLLVTDGEATGDLEPVRTCAPACSSGVQEGSETDVDCGGLCAPCAEQKACGDDADCVSGLCRQNVCVPAGCANEVKDGNETAVDCGGSCLPCANLQGCAVASDCYSGVCAGGMCVVSTCSDEIANGDETDVDCGGTCPERCAADKACAAAGDCASGLCSEGECLPEGCGNEGKDEDETDVDCGGVCAPCDDGKACLVPADCTSGACVGAVCSVNPCRNGVQDGDESDVDCGGSCPACPGARDCTAGTDCLSGTCIDCDEVACEGCDAGELTFAKQACRVDSALQQLYGQSPRVRSFVVGLAFESPSPYLNCHAVAGRTARDDTCSGVTAASCADTTTFPEACYYDARDQDSLSSAFDTIISQIKSCAFALGQQPPNPNDLRVYLDWHDDRVPSRELQQRFVNWTFDVSSNQIKFFGSACAAVQDGKASPLVVLGCPGGGG